MQQKQQQQQQQQQQLYFSIPTLVHGYRITL